MRRRLRSRRILLMAIFKRKYKSGAVVWGYNFSTAGSTREKRLQVVKWGFSSKGEAVDAEAVRRIEVQQAAAALAEVKPVAAIPRTLRELLLEFCVEHGDRKLAPKTVERYRESIPYLSAPLLDMPIDEITPLHLNREWTRLLESGGHHRKTRAARPLKPKTVRNIAGFVSSALGRGVKWGLLLRNPATDSEPPVPKKRMKLVFTTAQQDLMVGAAGGPWCLSTLLEVAAGSGARRGELLAARWSDLVGDQLVLERSLCQTKALGAFVKSVKTDDSVRVFTLPVSTMAALTAHRERQSGFRRQFGPHYRADLDLIFANEDGSMLKPNSVSSAVSLLAKRLKLHGSLHTFRHSNASHQLAAGVELPVVSKRLGHSSVKVTAEIYSHVVSGRDAEAARLWEEFQKKNRSVVSEKTQ
jgi:integrase